MPTKTPANISPRSSAFKIGTTISCPRRHRKLKLNGASIELKSYKPAHTDSDLSVTFGEADILHVGDTYWNGIYPFIDYSTGGSIDGMIAASDVNLAAATDNTIIIPGHGKPVSNKAELKAFRDMLVDIRDKVAALKKAGRALPETVAAKPTADHDAKWGQFVIDPSDVIRVAGVSDFPYWPGVEELLRSVRASGFPADKGLWN